MRRFFGGRARRGLLGALGSMALAFWTSCENTADDSKPPARPLEFLYFIHPGALDASSPGVVRAGVFVGPNGCWHLGGATLVRDGNRIVLSGYALGESGPVVCPAVIVYDTLTLDIPPLEPGEYRIEAGELADTLLVGSPAPRPAGVFFAAHGTLAARSSVPSGSPGCILFHCPYPGGEEISGILDEPSMAQPPPLGVILVGSVTGRDSCAGMEFPVIRGRRLIFE